MNNFFSDLLDVYIMINLDDILIYSNHMFKHCQHVKKVLKHLYKASFYTKVEKYKFYFKSVGYLGYSFFFWSYYVQQQSKDYSRLAKVQKSQEHSVFLRFY